MKREVTQKDIVTEIYNRISAMNWKIFIPCGTTLVGLMVLCSIFLGNPFPHKQFIVIAEIWVEGWILEYEELFFVICFTTFCVTLGWEVKEIYQTFKPLKNIILEECDPLKVVAITERAVEYPVKNRFAKQVALSQFEQLYVESLNASGQYDLALDYLKTQWRSKKSSYYKMLKAQIEMNQAVVAKNKEAYMALYTQAPKSLKNTIITQVQKCIMEEDYEKAILILKKMKCKYFVYKVQLMYFYGKCYFDMQDYAKAESYLDYVVRNGNTLVYQKEAQEMLKSIYK